MFRKSNPLDDSLIQWPDGSSFPVRDMHRSVEVKGITGSGKSSGPLATFRRNLAAHPRATMTIIAQKPEEREEVIDDFRRAGKLDKLIIIDKEAKSRCNYLDQVSKAGDARAVVDFFRTSNEMLSAGRSGGRSNEQFWGEGEDRMIYGGVEALRLGGEDVSAPNLLDFFGTAARDPRIFTEEAFRQMRERFDNGYHQRVMARGEGNVAKAEDALAGKIARGNWQVVREYWKEFMYMDERLRGGFQAGVMNVLQAALTGLGRIVTSTDTNVTPALMEKGCSFLLDFPFSEWGPTGRYIAGGWKYLTQKYVLARHWNPSSFYNVLILDEFQESITEFDPRYLAQCRSHGGCMLCLTQTVHSEYSAMGGGHASHHKVDALSANFGLSIYCLVDPATAKKASEKLGTRREVFVTPSAGKASTYDLLAGRAGDSFSIREEYQPILRETAFMTGLRCGGPDNDNSVDAIVIRPGEVFRNGENYLRVTFKQPKQ